MLAQQKISNLSEDLKIALRRGGGEFGELRVGACFLTVGKQQLKGHKL